MRLKLIAVIVCLSAILFAACKKDEIIVELNKVPAVNAGPYQLITLDTDSITLAGSATDTDGTVVAYLWSQVSGPVPATLGTPGFVTTYISNLINGTYVFQLMATDNDGATGVDTVSIKIDRPIEHSLVLQPVNSTGEHMLGVKNGQNQSTNVAIDALVAAWTNGGETVILRQLLKFDLGTIPANAVIKSANLYLYSHPPPLNSGNFTDANFGTNNAFYVQQVTSNWSGNVPWASQPTTTTTNQVLVPHTAQSMLDLNIDVKPMVASMISTNNYGFMLKLQSETIYTSRIFVGSRTANQQAKYPKLVVVYQ